MHETNLAAQFEENRTRLRAVARRMLGSAAEAEDAVQETWLRLNRSGSEDIGNLGGWLTTVTARICLDILRARAARPEAPLDDDTDLDPARQAATDAELMLADSMGPALTLVLDLLPPAERVAFVLHDMFAVPFEEVASVLGRSSVAARQLASRARRRIQNREAPVEAENNPHRGVVDAFLKASREGDFEGLLALLAPDVALHADSLAVQVATARAQAGAPLLALEVRGARAVAEVFKGRATGAVKAMIDGAPGAVWAQGNKVRSAFVFRVENEKIAGIDLVMNPASLQALVVEILP